MVKHKKTLEQKKKSDLRVHATPGIDIPTGSIPSTTFSLSSYKFASPVSSQKTSPTQPMSLTHGLEKSLIVSSVIVIFQLAIFFLLTHHILILPGNLIQY